MNQTTPKHDLTAFTPEQLAIAIANAVRLGAEDATHRRDEKKGREVLTALGMGAHRKAHTRFFQTAYMAGRFQVETALLED